MAIEADVKDCVSFGISGGDFFKNLFAISKVLRKFTDRDGCFYLSHPLNLI